MLMFVKCVKFTCFEKKKKYEKNLLKKTGISGSSLCKVKDSYSCTDLKKS